MEDEHTLITVHLHRDLLKSKGLKVGCNSRIEKKQKNKTEPL
jgi:hypothetical protein